MEAPRKFIVPIGPQHPALKEPGHFEFTVDGEIVTGATMRLGYVHRGIEKGAEGAQLDPEYVFVRTHLRDLLARAHSRACAIGVGRLAGVTGSATGAGDPHR